MTKTTKPLATLGFLLALTFLYKTVIHQQHEPAVYQRDANNPKTSNTRNRTAVFLVTQCRSGSSILGELFNRRERVTYLYEPLYPFRAQACSPPPVELVGKSVRAVEAMTRCDFGGLPKFYKEAYAHTGLEDHARCDENAFGFVTLIPL